MRDDGLWANDHLHAWSDRWARIVLCRALGHVQLHLMSALRGAVYQNDILEAETRIAVDCGADAGKLAHGPRPRDGRW